MLRLRDYFTMVAFLGVVFHADREKMLPFRDYRDGLETLGQLRTG